MKKTISFSILLLSVMTLSTTAMFSSAEEVQALVVDNGDDGDNRVERIAICHKDKLDLLLPAKAIAVHLRHGDNLGACNTPPPPTP